MDFQTLTQEVLPHIVKNSDKLSIILDNPDAIQNSDQLCEICQKFSYNEKKQILQRHPDKLSPKLIQECLGMISCDSELLDFFRMFKSSFTHRDAVKYIGIFKSENTKLDFMKILYNQGGFISKQDILTCLEHYKSDCNKVDVIKYFNKWFTHDDIGNIITFLKSDSYKFDVIKLLHKNKNEITGTVEITRQQIVDLLKTFSDSYRKDLIHYFNEWFSHDDIELLISKMSSDSYKLDIMKMLHKNKNRMTGTVEITKQQIINLLKTFSDSYKKDVIHYFNQWFSHDDIELLIQKMSSDSYRIDIIKMLHKNKNRVTGTIEITKQQIINCLKTLSDSYKKDVILYFKDWFRGPDLPMILQHFESCNYHMDIIRPLHNYKIVISFQDMITIVSNVPGSVGLDILKYFKPWINNQDRMLQSFRALSNKAGHIDSVQSMLFNMSTNTSTVTIGSTNLDKWRLLLSQELNWVDYTSDAESLEQFLDLVTSDESKIEFLKKKLVQVGQVRDDFYLCVKCFRDEKFKIKAMSMICEKYNTLTKIPVSTFPAILDEFQTGSRKSVLKYLLGCCAGTLDEEVVIQIATKLQSGAKAKDFISSFPAFDPEKVKLMMDASGYKIDHQIDSDSEDDEVDDDEINDLGQISYNINNIIEINVRGYVYEYDPRIDKSWIKECPTGSICIDGVNLNSEATMAGRKIVADMKQEQEKKRVKKTRLVVPRTPDELVSDPSEQCVRCKKRQKCVLLNCGHLTLCKHCTRRVIKLSGCCTVESCKMKIVKVTVTYD